MKLYMFRTVPLSFIRSYSLYTEQRYMSYGFVDSFRARSGWNCSFQPKHVEFHFKNKFEKLVHMVGFIIRKDISRLLWSFKSMERLVYVPTAGTVLVVNPAHCSCFSHFKTSMVSAIYIVVNVVWLKSVRSAHFLNQMNAFVYFTKNTHTAFLR
jgi:hypothetical protein